MRILISVTGAVLAMAPLCRAEEITLQGGATLVAPILKRSEKTVVIDLGYDVLRVPATEILVSTPAVRNCIRENRIFEIPNIIETNRALGMRLFDESLKQLYFSGMISREDAVVCARSSDQMERALSA